jgi:hypothetical protein
MRVFEAAMALDQVAKAFGSGLVGTRRETIIGEVRIRRGDGIESGRRSFDSGCAWQGGEVLVGLQFVVLRDAGERQGKDNDRREGGGEALHDLKFL